MPHTISLIFTTYAGMDIGRDNGGVVVLEVLHRVLLGGLRIVERVGEAGAVDRLLLDPVDDVRRRDPHELQDGGDDVDAVGELRPQVAPRVDPVRPRDDHRVTRATQMARHLLTPLERRVLGVRPRSRVMGGGVEAAQLRRRRTSR